MDYDDDDFQNQNLHLVGEANSKFPPVLQSFALPKFDFEDTDLRFGDLVDTEAFLGMEGDQDSKWIEDYSPGSSGIVFSSVATETCAIPRNNNVWSEATSSESVEMLLNSVGQDEVIVREDTIKISEISDEQGCSMEQVEAGQTNNEDIILQEETADVQPKPSVDDSPGESSLLKTDSGQEQVLVKDDSPTVAEESTMVEKNTILASDNKDIEDVDAAGDGMIGTERTDSLLDQIVTEELSMEDKNAVLGSDTATEEAVNSDGHGKIGTEISDSPHQTVAEELSMEDKNAVLSSNTANVEDVSSAGDDNIGTQTTENLLDQTVTGDSLMEENNAVLASDTTTVEALNSAGHDKIGTEKTDSHLDLTITEELPALASDTTTVEAVNSACHVKIDTEMPDILLDQKVAEESSMEVKNAVLASDTATVETVNTVAQDKIGNEMIDSLLDQTEDKANSESKMEIDDSVGIVQTGVTGSCELNNQMTLLPETFNDENDISDQTLSAHEVGELDVSETQFQDVLVSSAHTTACEHESTIQTEAHAQMVLVETSESVYVSQMDSVDESTEVVPKKGGNYDGSARLSNLKQSTELAETIVSETVGFRESASKLVEPKSQPDTTPTDKPGTQFQDVLVSSAHTTASEHESTIQTETHAQMVVVETSESVYVSQMDSADESTEVVVSKKCGNNDGSARLSNLKQSTELAETIVSESAGSRESASKLLEPKSQPDTIPTDKSGTMIDDKECETFSSQDRAPAVSLTSAEDLHMLNTSSDSTEQVRFPETEKVSPGGPENSQTVQPETASSLGSHMEQQGRKLTDVIQQGTQFVEGCPASEGSKDAANADAARQALLQQSEKTILDKNLVTEDVTVPETQSNLDNDGINEKPNTSSLANIGSEAGEDGVKEENTAASSGMKTAGTPVSHPTGDVIKIGDSCASTSVEAIAKSHVTGAKAATNLGTPVISFPVVETSELQLNKTKTNSVQKAEDQNISSFRSAESSVLNNNETFSTELNFPSGPRKAGEISEVVNFSQATLVSPIVVQSPSTSSLEKTAAKSSKTKSERKPRGTPKSAAKETSRKRNSVKGVQSSASSLQITQSTEKQQSLQTHTPTSSLPDLNSSALSSILRRPFTDLQHVQLRSQIFVYGALIQGTAPDEAYMRSAFGGPDGGKDSWEKAWRACAVRAQKMHVSTPGTPLQSRQGNTGTPSVVHTSSRENSAIKPIIPLSSPLWSLSTSLDTLQSSSIQRGSAAAQQSLLSSSHAHQTATPWMSPLPFRNPWLASPGTSGFDGGSRFPIFPITESAKLTPTKEPPLPYSGGKHVLSETSSNVHKGTPTLEPASTVVAPAQHSTGTKSRKRKKMPVSVESGPSILNSLKQTELVVSPLVSMSTSVPITAATGSLASNAGALPTVTAVPVNLVSTFPGKKMKSSLASPIFGGNLVPEVKQRSVLSVDTIDKLNEAKMHAEDASALATAAVSHSEYIWKQIDQQRHAGLQSETQGKLAWAAVAIAAAAAVAKAAAAASNVAANAALQAKLMAEEASLPSVSQQGNELPKSNDGIIQGQGTPASVLKGEGAVVSSTLVLSAAREAAKRRVEDATVATKRAENMDSIVKAAELASEAVSQAGVLVSMGHPPSLDKLVEAGASNYWRQVQESEEAHPSKVGVSGKETMVTSDGTFASPRTVTTELDGSVRTADGSATGKKTKGQKGHNGAELPKNNVVFEPVGSKSFTQIESEQIMKTTNDECIKEGSHVEVFKEGPELRTAWYSANVLSLEDGKAYVLFNDLSVEQGTDKLKEWISLKGDGDEAPKIRTARSVTAMPYEGTRKRRRSAIGDPVWKIGDRVDSWVHDSWLEGVIMEKNKKDENTVTVHFPAQGDTLTIKAWNLRPSLVWKDGRWIECSTSGENIGSSHEGDTPKEKRPRLAAPALVAEAKDAKMKIIDDADAKPTQTGVLDLGVSENTFNIGRSTTKEENKTGPLRMKRTGLQTQGAKVIYGVPKPGKKRKFMDVSKHYVSEASTKTRERKEPAKPAKSIVPQNPRPGSWRMPSKTVSREKQTTVSKPKTFRPAPKPKEKPVAAGRIIPRKDSRNTTSAESADAVDQSGENKEPLSETATSVPSKGTGEEQTSSSSQGQDTSSLGTSNKGKVAPSAGRLAKIEEDKALEPRRSVRRIQPTSRLLEGLQTSMMTSKLPSLSHSKSHQNRK